MIVVENTSSSGDQANKTSYSWNHECTGSDRLLVVCVRAVDTSENDRRVDSITYNGQVLAIAGYHNVIAPLNAEIWYLVNPDTGGAYAIEVTHRGKCSDASAGAISLTGIDTEDPLDNSIPRTGTSGNPYADVVCAANTILIGCVTTEQSDPAKFSCDDNEIDEVDMGNNIGGAGYTFTDGAGTYEINWTDGDGDEKWITEGYSFNPAPPSSNIKKLSGVAQASLKKVSGVVIASVKKVAGVSNV